MKRMICACSMLVLVLAVAGCHGVSESIKSDLDYAWGKAILPGYTEYVQANAALDDAGKAAALVEAETATQAVRADTHGIWAVDKKYAAAVEAACEPVLAKYESYLIADDSLGDMQRKTLLRTILLFRETLLKAKE